MFVRRTEKLGVWAFVGMNNESWKSVLINVK